MRPTLQTVPENCPATANQTATGATVVPTTPNGNREPAAEKVTPTSNTVAVTQEIKAPHPPQSQQLQAVKPRNSSRVSNFCFISTHHHHHHHAAHLVIIIFVLRSVKCHC